jgi:hypothetical protein
MEDLENERDMVAARLDQSNFEPVNAETMLPDGATSYDRISDEIETCHAFLVLSGTRYGWIPTAGPLSVENISVTHGEYRAARLLKLPILPFFKVLKYGADSTTDDAKRRDAFRKELGDWDTGQFRMEFTTARDLSDKAVAAVTRMLSDHFQRELIASRRLAARPVVPPAPPPAGKPELPPSLVTAVREGRAMLWAGSGISLRAGLPSAGALATEMSRLVQESLGVYASPTVGSGVASIASDFEMVLGRPSLLAKLEELLDLPGGVTPTPAHVAAITLFPKIVTTNYDRLFENAAGAAKSGHTLIAGPQLPSPVPEKIIWKIHGAWDWPELLVVSEGDIARFEASSSGLVEELRGILTRGPLLVGGTTLRDPSILRLFRALRGTFEGYWSVPPNDPLAVKRAVDLGLHPIETPIESVIEALREATSREETKSPQGS